MLQMWRAQSGSSENRGQNSTVFTVLYRTVSYQIVHNTVPCRTLLFSVRLALYSLIHVVSALWIDATANDFWLQSQIT